MATGSHMSNSFGFRDSKGFQPFLSGLKGYRNVYAAQAFDPSASLSCKRFTATWFPV